MMESAVTQFKPVGPLEIARENLECFADSFLQQAMLRAIVDAYQARDAIIEILGEKVEDVQLEDLWTAVADELKEKGISA